MLCIVQPLEFVKAIVNFLMVLQDPTSDKVLATRDLSLS